MTVEVLCSTNRKYFQMIRGLKHGAVARILFFEDSSNDLILSGSALTMYEKTKQKSVKLTGFATVVMFSSLMYVT